MKELTMYIRTEKLEQMKKILVDKHQCGGMTVSNVMGCGNQQGFAEEFRGTRTNDKVEQIADDVCSTLATGLVGDGKIFVKNVEEAIRIRTGEHGTQVV